MLPTRYAPFDRRFAAFILDWLLSWIAALVFVAPAVWLLIPENWIDELRAVGRVSESDFFQVYITGGGLWELLTRLIPWYLPVTAVGVFLVVTVLYYAVFESSRRQATPGKMLLGLFVTDLQGGRISFRRALGRTAVKGVGKLPFYWGYVLALFTGRSQALHDLVAGTLVLEPAQGSAPDQNIQEKITAGNDPDNSG
ncbi:MAG: RDD family protein, partial [Candidatus Glassbacteria bacterium]